MNSAPDSAIATTVQDLDDAPCGWIAVDRDLLVYTKPFHSSNQWLLGGFTEKFPASAISLPARLYRINADGELVPTKKTRLPIMMKNLKVIACDNPQCDTVLPAGDGPGPDGAPGYYIDKGSVHDSGGGGGFAKVYACTADCIAQAIKAVWDEGVIRKKW